MRVSKKKCKIRPIANRVVVERDPVSDVSLGGIVIAGDSTDIPIRTGVVVAAGFLDDADIEVGTRVIFGRYNGIPVGGEQVVLKEEELLGIMED